MEAKYEIEIETDSRIHYSRTGCDPAGENVLIRAGNDFFWHRLDDHIFSPSSRGYGYDANVWKTKDSRWERTRHADPIYTCNAIFI